MTDNAELPEPKGIALVICDSIYVDKTTHKKALVGLFTNITTHSTPAVHASMCVYAAVTEAMPNTIMKLDIVDATTLDPVFEAKEKEPLPKTDPRKIYEFMFTLSNVVFPKAAVYRVRILGNDISIMERPFTVSLIGNPDGDFGHEHNDD